MSPTASPADPHDAALDALRAEVAALRGVVEALVEKLDGGASTAGAVSVEEAAKMAGIGRSSMYALIKAGTVRPVRIKGRTLIPTTQIRALLRHGTA